MRTRWQEIALAAALGALALSLWSPARGQGQTPALIRGGGSAGVEKEPTYRFTTLKGNAATVQFDRNVLRVPSSFGRLIQVTMAGTKPVLWYEDSAGTLRNVVLRDAQSLVQVTRQPSQ